MVDSIIISHFITITEHGQRKQKQVRIPVLCVNENRDVATRGGGGGGGGVRSFLKFPHFPNTF